MIEALTKTNRLLQQLVYCSDQSKAHDSIRAFEQETNKAISAKARRYFEEFDTNEDGCLSKHELLDFISHTGREFKTPQKLLKCYELIDANGDGKIAIDEFVDWWSAHRDDFTVKTCSLEKVQMLVMGENQLIDRYARATGLSLVRLNIEIERLDQLLQNRRALQLKAMMLVLSAIFVAVQVAIQHYTEEVLTDLEQNSSTNV